MIYLVTKRLKFPTMAFSFLFWVKGKGKGGGRLAFDINIK